MKLPIEVIEKIFFYLEVKDILVASLTCHSWLKASQCLSVSKRICLNLSKQETVALFGHVATKHRRFCTVKIERVMGAQRCLKLNPIWRKYCQDIRQIIFDEPFVFSAISYALKYLQELESVEITNFISLCNSPVAPAQFEVNSKVTSLRLIDNYFDEAHLNHLLSITPNVTSFEWSKKVVYGQRVLYDFLTGPSSKNLRIQEYIQHIKYVDYVIIYDSGTREVLNLERM